MIRTQKIYVFFLFLIINLSFSQQSFEKINSDSIVVKNKKFYDFKYKQLIVPSLLISYGVLAVDNGQLEIFNAEIKEEVGEHIDDKISIDDFSQYAPLTSIFVLDLIGTKGKNNFKDKTIIAATSSLIMGITVASIKKITHIERPDGSSFNSFPSGHTATAFMGAELLHQEYKNISLWYSISGYLVATGTGIFRMLNNRHWLSDVVTGAGIGILSTKVAYWLYPEINKIFNKNSETSKIKTSFIPYYDGNKVGFGLVSTF